MFWMIMSLTIMVLFYGIYFGKMMMQKRKGIRTNQMAKRKAKDKIYYTELVLKLATFLVVPAELVSILCQWTCLPTSFRVLGIIIGFTGVVIFGIAVWTMKDSWRAGLAEEDKTEIVTDGIYKYSRNPAFLGFDMIYIGIALVYCNLPLVLCSVFAIVMLHIQIKQEEQYLPTVFGEEYLTYCKQVSRYLGRKRKREHLPMIGVGPIYVIIIVACTIAGIILSRTEVLESGKIEVLRIPFLVIGVILVLFGLYLWFSANFQSKLGRNIKSNTLVTTGIYSYVRNPIYSAFMLMCTGALLIANNCWLLILPVFYWGFMTVLMKNTEEKWLYNLYGEAYTEYCRRVNRCIPWIRK